MSNEFLAKLAKRVNTLNSFALRHLPVVLDQARKHNGKVFKVGGRPTKAMLSKFPRIEEEVLSDDGQYWYAGCYGCPKLYGPSLIFFKFYCSIHDETPFDTHVYEILIAKARDNRIVHVFGIDEIVKEYQLDTVHTGESLQKSMEAVKLIETQLEEAKKQIPLLIRNKLSI